LWIVAFSSGDPDNIKNEIVASVRCRILPTLPVGECILQMDKAPALNTIALEMRNLFSLGFTLLVLGFGGCSDPKKTSTTIRAIEPTGETFFTPSPQPIWSFGITNTGETEIEWRSTVELRGKGPQGYSHAGGFIEWPEGVLAPGEGLRTNMIVPAVSNMVWRAAVEFWQRPESIEQNVNSRDHATFLGPREKSKIAWFYDGWHTNR
jgi:hypothetical protein